MGIKRKDLAVWCIVSLLSVTGVLAATDLRLVEAARQGDTQAVRSLLEQHVDVNAAQADGATALAWAAYGDDLKTVGLLIGAGAKTNLANDYGVTPLFLACTNGSSAMVETLLKAGADPNSAEWKGATPLMECARTGNVDAVKSLLARKADLSAKEARQGHTALMQAVANKHAAIAKVLIEAGADVNARAKSGFTPLMFAAQQGDMDATRMLLAAGATVNNATNEEARWVGDTALLVASLNGHEELAIFLLDRGADPNAADDNGFTALHFAIFHGLTKMSGVRMRQYTGIFLARPNMVGLVKALLAHGANPNARVKTVHGGDRWLRVSGKYPTAGSVSPVGETPLMLAARTYDADLMRILVAGGADPMLTTEEGVTVLMAAAGVSRYRGTGPPLTEEQETNALEAVKLAVELGNDVNAADTAFGLTALHGAAFSGSDRIIQYLAEKGANLDAKDITGHTALHKALNITPPGKDIDNLVPKIVRKSTADLLLKLGATPVKISGTQGSNAGSATQK